MLNIYRGLSKAIKDDVVSLRGEVAQLHLG